MSGRGSRKWKYPSPSDAVGCGASRVGELKRAFAEQGKLTKSVGHKFGSRLSVGSILTSSTYSVMYNVEIECSKH